MFWECVLVLLLLGVEIFTFFGRECQGKWVQYLWYIGPSLENFQGIPGFDQVILRRHNEETRNLVGKLFPGREGSTIMRGEKKA